MLLKINVTNIILFKSSYYEITYSANIKFIVLSNVFKPKTLRTRMLYLNYSKYQIADAL